MIYDYLFYKSYQLATKSKNWKDTPVFFATIVMAWCLILNFASILFLIEALTKNKMAFGPYISKMNNIKYIFGIVLITAIWMYYSHKNRWKKIITRYQEREGETANIHPAIVVIVACGLSFILGALSAMYKNGDGIFG
ncbi:hypothetical protein [Taibaiella chishuiensis]|uniref:Uncharacterized protein n=1 Tax=Taibaiella chishuiensis TaxID=1434707 RepID=A0A2P8D066_9BACT|nr:hypothetical protein [Taibaiella chishuiensis]PSK90600.1 hypothetical protein B0I18_10710 [Taibaiella chishuiensis]